MRPSNYDKFPATSISGTAVVGWKAIVDTLNSQWSECDVWGIDLYVGSFEEDFIQAFAATGRGIVCTRELMHHENHINQLTRRFMTEDVLFGFFSNVKLHEYFNPTKCEMLAKRIAAGERLIVIGTGAACFIPNDAPLAYADMARWEIQQRFRRHEVTAIGIDNRHEDVSLQYKRGYFNDWIICDQHKDSLLQDNRISFWIDCNARKSPKMITNEQMRQGLLLTVSKPFRVVPFFDPAPWGGQWMKQVCDLPREQANYGWCFDCVPEENSLLLNANGILFELPSQNLLLCHSLELLGEKVQARFGKEFPIRFDFLDTMGGGNLSLQVHPTNEFAHKAFGLHYTQDESYYLLDASPNANVFLGLKEGINPDEMLSDLRAAQRGGLSFDADKYVNKFPAKKHDHFLIPSGTVHCSGGGGMVLEISTTPSIFTFKLWDWNRLGLDGKPRPINVERGSQVIQWNRTTSFVERQLCNCFETLEQSDGLVVERTGLHHTEFIETHRHTFSRTAQHDTFGVVNVLNLVDGYEAIVESAEGKFEPFTVHYAETFIIPACVGKYSITPIGGECKTIKAFIRNS